MDKERFNSLVRSIYTAADALEAMFPGRHFTPDGHMIGSLGEALAAFHYGVDLLAASANCHDGTCGGWNVQIKTTQRDRIAISSEPEHLLVLKLTRDGSFKEIYNGPGSLVWDGVRGKAFPKNGQHQIALSKLKSLMSKVQPHEQIPRRDA